MNTSLRRISMMVMGLVDLLLINATITQVFRADALRADPRNQRVLSTVRPPARADRRQRTVAGLLGGDDRALPLPAGVSRPMICARSPASTRCASPGTGLERAEDPILNGSDGRLFGKRLADFFTGRDPRGGNVGRRSSPGAAGRVGGHAAGLQRGCKGFGGGTGALDREDLAMVSRAVVRPPTCCPPRHRGQGPGVGAAARRSRFAADQSGDLPSGTPGRRSGHHHRRSATGRHHRERATDRRPQIVLPNSTATLENYGGTPCGAGQAPLRGRSSGPAIPRSSNSVSASAATPSATPPTRSASTTNPTRSRCRSPSPPSGRWPTVPRSACRAWGRRTSRSRRCRTPWSPRQSPTAGGDAAIPGAAARGTGSFRHQQHRTGEQRRAVPAEVAAKLTGFDDRRREVHPAEQGDSGRADRIQDRDRRHGTDPRNTRRTPGTSHLRPLRIPGSRSRCWSRTAATGSRRPAARWLPDRPRDDRGGIAGAP